MSKVKGLIQNELFLSVLLIILISALAYLPLIKQLGFYGDDWANAYTSLPADLTRGHTYYIATGTYGSYIFDDPKVSNQYITIKKATVTDHGTPVGWDNSYGDRQAVFYSNNPARSHTYRFTLVCTAHNSCNTSGFPGA